MRILHSVTSFNDAEVEEKLKLDIQILDRIHILISLCKSHVQGLGQQYQAQEKTYSPDKGDHY